MRIAVIRQRFVASGGAELYLRSLIQGLLARGHEVHVLANVWRAEPAAPVHFHRVPMVRLTAFARALSFALSAQRQVGRVGCDLVLSLERTLQHDVYTAIDGCHREWLAQRRRHGPAWKGASFAINPLHRTLLALERRLFHPEHTRRVIVISRRGAREISRHYGYPAGRIHLVYPGVDLERFQPEHGQEARAAGVPSLPGRSSGFQLLFVGSGFERKGLPWCIQALARLPANTRLQIVGKGNVSLARRRAVQAGVGDRVEFLGYDLDSARVFPGADLLVHPAMYEAFGIVCLEALACGLPVITSEVTGASELIESGRTGAVVARPADIAGLAAAIQPFLNRDRLASAAIECRRVAEAHPLSRNVRETLAVLEQALSTGDPSTPRPESAGH